MNQVSGNVGREPWRLRRPPRGPCRVCCWFSFRAFPRGQVLGRRGEKRILSRRARFPSRVPFRFSFRFWSSFFPTFDRFLRPARLDVRRAESSPPTRTAIFDITVRRSYGYVPSRS